MRARVRLDPNLSNLASWLDGRGSAGASGDAADIRRRLDAFLQRSGVAAMSNAVQMARDRGFSAPGAVEEARMQSMSPDERLQSARLGGGYSTAWLPETEGELGNGNYWQAVGHAIASYGAAPSIKDFLPRVGAGAGINSDLSSTADLANLSGQSYNSMAQAAGSVSDRDREEFEQLRNGLSRARDSQTRDYLMGLLERNNYYRFGQTAADTYESQFGRPYNRANLDALLGAY